VTRQCLCVDALGHGEALYEIGVEDDGSALGLSESDLHSSLQNLNEMARRLNAETSILCERQGREGRVVELLVRYGLMQS
jgi:GTPase